MKSVLRVRHHGAGSGYQGDDCPDHTGVDLEMIYCFYSLSVVRGTGDFQCFRVVHALLRAAHDALLVHALPHAAHDVLAVRVARALLHAARDPSAGPDADHSAILEDSGAADCCAPVYLSVGGRLVCAEYVFAQPVLLFLGLTHQKRRQLWPILPF